MFGLFLQGFLFQLQGVLCHGVNYEIGEKSRRKAPKQYCRPSARTSPPQVPSVMPEKYAVFRTIKGLC